MKKNPSQYQSNPKKILDRLTVAQRSVMSLLLDWSRDPRYRIGGMHIGQAKLGDLVGIRRESANKAIGFLKDMGLIEVEGRTNNTNITKISSWWGLPYVQKLLPHYFKKYPIFSIALPLFLLTSLWIRVDNENKSHNTSGYGSAIRNGFNIWSRQRRDQYRVAMKHKIEKVNAIRAALIQRGERELIDPYKLLAFSEECLDDCIAHMKHAKPKYPYRYFLAKALEWGKNNNQEPDWLSADALRETRIPEFESNRPAGNNKKDGNKFIVQGASPAPVVAKPVASSMQKTLENQKREKLESDERMKRIGEQRQQKTAEEFALLDIDQKIQRTKSSLAFAAIMINSPTGVANREALQAQLAALVAERDRQQTPWPPLPEVPRDEFGRVDLFHPDIEPIVQAQADRLVQVGLECEEGVRLRRWLNGVGVPI